MSKRAAATVATTAPMVKMNRVDLVAALQNIAKVVRPTRVEDVWNNVLATVVNGVMELRGTDTVATVVLKLPAESADEISFLIPRTLSSYIGHLSADEITLQINDGSVDVVDVTAGTSTAKIQTPPLAKVVEFPKPEVKEETVSCVVPLTALRAAVDTVAFAKAAREDAKPQFMGIHFAGTAGESILRLGATDNRVAAAAQCPTSEPLSADVSAVFFPQIQDALDLIVDEKVEMRISGRQVQMACDNLEITVALIGFQFPDVRKFLAAEDLGQVTVDKGLVLGALGRAEIVATQNDKDIILDMTENALTISAKTDLGSITDTIAVTNGPTVRLRLGTHFLKQAVRAMAKGDQVTLRFYGEAKPVWVASPQDDKAFAWVMPMRQPSN